MKTNFTIPVILIDRLVSRTIMIFGILIISAFIIPANSFAQGVPISNAANDQINATITTDGANGSIMTWQDKRSGKFEIYAQRTNPSGNPIWATNGVAICTQDSNFLPNIVSDGLGGALIAWQSYRGSATADIYVQHINSTGNVLLANNGAPLCTVVFDQINIAMVPDGVGGAILTWMDYRSNNGFADIYAQRVSSLGVMLWTANGVSICNQAAEQNGPKIISDGSGGAFVTWADFRAGNFDIYTQRIGSGGAVMFTTNGVATCTMATDQTKPDLCSDGANGIIVTWTDFRSTTDLNIYAQRMGPALAIVWTVDGVVMNNNVAYDQTDPQIVSDGVGGAIIAWADKRTGITSDIYAQRVNSTGAVQWTATGVIICTAAGDQIKPQIISDGNSGAYFVWEDHRNAGNSDIYAQRIASNAALNWAATGFAICTNNNDQLSPRMFINGNQGAIVVWQDYRSGSSFDIYETGFNTTGLVGIGNGNVTTTPTEYSLSQNFPNPFNPQTLINYNIPQNGNVRISIYDGIGRLVNTLIDQNQNAGSHEVTWNAASYSSGIYFYKLESGSFVETKRMTLIK
ncbi:hypothetical protein BH10BAC5_BH10BAC5_27930 [soil metagenome]